MGNMLKHINLFPNKNIVFKVRKSFTSITPQNPKT